MRGGTGEPLSCLLLLLLLPGPMQLICKEAEGEELHLQAGQGSPGSSSGRAGCGQSWIAVLRMTVLKVWVMTRQELPQPSSTRRQRKLAPTALSYLPRQVNINLYSAARCWKSELG